MRLFNYTPQMLGDNIQIHTIGCEASMSDAYNFACTLPKDEKAIVFNTCSFIEDRSIESQMLTRVLHKAYPDHKMYVLGCDVNLNKPKFEQDMTLCTNEDVTKQICHREILENVKVKSHLDNASLHEEDPSINIKVQDGCSHRCTYCIINQLRNKPYSVPYNELVDLIKEQIKARPHYKKVVLCGTEIATYYDETTGYKLSDVLKHLIQDIPSIRRIVLTAIDPATKESEEIIKVIGSNERYFVPYILIGAQCGSDTILRAMKRRHNVERLRYIHKLAKEYGVTVGWDMIIGFPGETDELFNETVELMKELKPLTHNIFMYSDREGTPASKFPNKVPKATLLKRDTFVHNLMCQYYKEAPSKAYDEYYDSTGKDKQINFNRQEALKMLTENEDEIFLDLLNEDDVAKFIKAPPENTIVHVRYDMERDVECEIMIYFLTGYVRGVPIVLHVPREFVDRYNVKEFEEVFLCIVVVD